jgi:proline dehydrogenase
VGVFDKSLASLLPALPKGVVHSVARRYIAGASLDEALACVEGLNEAGAAATVDILGESCEDRDAALRTRDAYAELLGALDERGLDANVSIKLTALGLALDPGLCEESVRALCTQAGELENFVRIDMEDSPYTQATLDLYESLRADFDNVGPVLQAYLRRTIEDAKALAAHQASVRLCKGIYVEPRKIAWKDRETVRRNFVRALDIMMAGGCYLGIATHDELLVWEALRLIDEHELSHEDYEFQMLLGVDDELREILIDGGHRLRVYVPFGEQWYEYSMRRLKENPEIAGHVARATLSR